MIVFLMFIIVAPIFLNSCKDNPKPVVAARPIERVTKKDVLGKAKIFLHILRGEDAVGYYNQSDMSPEVFFDNNKNVWIVSFYNMFGGLTIYLDQGAEKANYILPNGFIFKKNANDITDSENPPLYSVEEMVELMSFYHNSNKRR